ncbi:50S ribosomal protein L15 [Candidatus Dependentiae bacterium]
MRLLEKKLVRNKMLQLNNLESISRKRKRIGRGGDLGGTSGRGHKGQKARSGGKSKIKASFEGGQMPLSRRLPKRGFNNPFKKEFKIINLSDLETFFSAEDKVDETALRKRGIVKGKKKIMIKILGKGKLTKKLDVVADAFSKTAVEAIKNFGGKIKLTKEL